MHRTVLIPACAAVLALGCGGGNNGPDDADEDDVGTDVETEDSTPADVDGEDTGGDGTSDPSTDDAAGDPPDDPTEDDPSTEPSDELRFTNIRCLPDVGAGDDVVDGQNLFCRFEVRGATGRRVDLSCEDESGSVIDCSSSSTSQIQPFGSNPLPVFNGWFGTGTSGLAGTTIVIIWVADDTVDQVRHRFEADVIADDGTNGPPSIEVSCEGDTDGDVSVTAGDRLDCMLFFLDPDPDSLDWDYTQTSGPTPVTSPAPYGATGPAPFDVTWRWQTDSGESGAFVYTFSVDDGTAAAVTYDLTVNVS